MECSLRRKVHIKENNHDISDPHLVTNYEDPQPASCKLNPSKDVNEFKPKPNSVLTKVQRSRRGLHFGAKKINPDIFEMKEKEIVDKTPNTILQSTVLNVEKNQSLNLNMTKDDESEDGNNTRTNEIPRKTENQLHSPENRQELTHSAQQSMAVIGRGMRSKSGPGNTGEFWMNAIPGDVPKRTNPSSEKHFPNVIGEAQRKFGSAKSISSDQYFEEVSDPVLCRSELLRFTNSSSISSDEFFHRGRSELGLGDLLTASLETLGLEEMAGSVRRCVGKVAETLGSFVSGFMAGMPHDFGEL